MHIIYPCIQLKGKKTEKFTSTSGIEILSIFPLFLITTKSRYYLATLKNKTKQTTPSFQVLEIYESSLNPLDLIRLYMLIGT